MCCFYVFLFVFVFKEMRSETVRSNRRIPRGIGDGESAESDC